MSSTSDLQLAKEYLNIFWEDKGLNTSKVKTDLAYQAYTDIAVLDFKQGTEEQPIYPLKNYLFNTVAKGLFANEEEFKNRLAEDLYSRKIFQYYLNSFITNGKQFSSDMEQFTLITLSSMLQKDVEKLLSYFKNNILADMVSYNNTNLEGFFPETYLEDILNDYVIYTFTYGKDKNDYKSFLENEKTKVNTKARGIVDHVWKQLNMDNESAYVDIINLYLNNYIKTTLPNEKPLENNQLNQLVINQLNTNKMLQHIFNQLTRVAETNIRLIMSGELENFLLKSLKDIVRNETISTTDHILEDILEQEGIDVSESSKTNLKKSMVGTPTNNGEQADVTGKGETTNNQSKAEKIVLDLLSTPKFKPNIKESKFAKDLFKQVIENKYGKTNIPSETLIVGSVRSDVLTTVSMKSFTKSYYTKAVEQVLNALNTQGTSVKLPDLMKIAEDSYTKSLLSKIELEVMSVEDNVINSFHNEVGEDTTLTNLDESVNKVMVNMVNKNTRVNIPLEVEDFLENMGNNDDTGENQYDSTINKFWSELSERGYLFYNNEFKENIKPLLIGVISSDKFNNSDKKFLYNFMELQSALKENITQLKLVNKDGKLIEFILKHELNNLKKIDLNTFNYITENFKQFKGKISKGELMTIKRNNILDDDSLSKRYLLYIKELILEAQKRQLFDEEIEINLPNSEQQMKDLKQGVVRIVMSKTNGEKRVMWATLNERIIALTHKEETYVDALNLLNSMKQDKSYVKVYDIEKMEQRSYNPSRLIENLDETGKTGWTAYKSTDSEWLKEMKGLSTNEEIKQYLDSFSSSRVNLMELYDKGTIDRKKLELKISESQTNTSTAHSKEDILKIVKELGKGRSNPVIEVLQEQGILIKPFKTFIEPFSRYLLANLHVLNNIQDAEVTKEEILGLFRDNEDIRNILLNEAKIVGVNIDGELTIIFNRIISNSMNNDMFDESNFIDLDKIITPQLLSQLHLKYFHLGYNSQEYYDSVEEEVHIIISKLLTHPFGKLFNAKTEFNTPDELRQHLKTHVGFITFVKGDMKDRTMFATANGEIWRHFIYQNDKENYKVELNEEGHVVSNLPTDEELESPNIKVMDLELLNARNFNRQFRFDRIHYKGLQTSPESPLLPNYIWINIENAYWYELVKSGMSVLEIIKTLETKQYINYETGEIEAPILRGEVREELMNGLEETETEINELIRLAQEEFIRENPDSELARSMQQDLEDEEDEVQELTEKQKEEQQLAIDTYKQVVNALKTVTWARYDYDLYQKILEVMNHHQVEIKLDPLAPENKDKITMSMRDDNNLFIVLQARNVTYYITPQFMVNDMGYNVFRDRTETIKFPRRALTLETDRLHENLINDVLKLINKRREVLEFEIAPITMKSDIERLKRMSMLVSPEFREKYDLTNVSMRYNNVGKQSHLEIVTKDNNGNNVSLLLSPTSLLNQTNSEIYHQRKAGESSVSSLANSINKLHQRSILPVESLKLIGKIAQLTCDLRRKL